VIVGALDIGGSHVTAGNVDLAARSLVTRTRAALPGGADLVAAIVNAAAPLAGVDRVGVAVPGPFDYAAGVSRMAHKLQGLYGVELETQLRRAPGLGRARFRFVNDADAFLLGEWWAGAARGHARAVGITLGTGLGSAFLADGRIVDSGPELYELPFRGAPVERTISSGALLARYGDEGIEVEEIARRAAGGDRRARDVFAELGRALGEFLLPVLRPFEPSCLVVGGSIARSWALFEAGLRSELESIESLASVVAAAQLDDAPLLGAARHAAGDEW
jgi:glucokinase